MHKILAILIVSPAFIYAAYNPFFKDETPKKPSNMQIKQIKPITYTPRPRQKRVTIEMTYFGFIESNKGLFALVKFNKKNIVVRQNDSVYHDDQVFKIKKITSNYILIRDKKGRAETVYFSSAKAENQGVQY